MANETPPRYTTTLSSNITSESGNPLTTLIRRLEAATSRLEDIASSSASIEQQAHGSANGSISAASGIAAGASGVPNLDALKREGSMATVVKKQEVPARIGEMDQLIEGEVEKFVEAAKAVDGELVEEQVRPWKGYKERMNNEDGMVDEKFPRHHPSPRHSQTSGASYSSRRKLRSRIHSRKHSWISSPTYNRIWGRWETYGIATAHRQ